VTRARAARRLTKDYLLQCQVCQKGNIAMSRRSFESTVALQIRQWEIDRQSRLMASARPHCPIITISREIGSGGSSIGKMTARKLRFLFLDRKIVESIAERTSTDAGAVGVIDEKIISYVEEVLRDNMLSKSISMSEYMKHLTAVLIVAAEHGRAVVIGRGSNFLLKAYPHFRVRIVCPLQQRIERIAARDQISLKASRHKVQKSDTDRAAFIKRYFRAAVEDATHYELVINTEKLTVEQASDTIVKTYRALFPKKGAGRK
jgi:cytidylate kinase